MATRHITDIESGPVSIFPSQHKAPNQVDDFPPTQQAGGEASAQRQSVDDEVLSALVNFWPDWHYEGLIGRGTYGSVHKISREWPTHSVKAVKMIEVGGFKTFSKQAKDSYYNGLRERMVSEIEVMESLNGVSQNIVGVEDSHICDRRSGEGFIIGFRMDLLEGLYEHIEKIGGITPVEAVRIVKDVCRALITCHSQHPVIIHRDVKPANIFWFEKLQKYQLGDFGVARQLDDDARSRSMSFAGTESYIAPEVFAKLHGGKGGYGSNADVYSLGVVLFYLLNDDMPPFNDDGQRLQGKRLPNPKYGDDYLADVIRSATNAEPRYRFQTAQAFLNALEAWPAGGDQ